jgi:hypothetical protein
MHLPCSLLADGTSSVLVFGDPALDSALVDTKAVLLSLAALPLMGCGGSKRRVTGVAGVTSDVN